LILEDPVQIRTIRNQSILQQVPPRQLFILNATKATLNRNNSDGITLTEKQDRDNRTGEQNQNGKENTAKSLLEGYEKTSLLLSQSLRRLRLYQVPAMQRQDKSKKIPPCYPY
jgi:hypothetical protein